MAYPMFKGARPYFQLSRALLTTSQWRTKCPSSLLSRPSNMRKAHSSAATSGRSWNILGDLAAPIAFDGLELEPSDYHLIIIYLYSHSAMVHQLDVAIPQEIPVHDHITNEISVFCRGQPLDKFLMARLDNMPKAAERGICLKIARWCVASKVRSLHRIRNPYNQVSFIAELEVGKVRDWAEYRQRAYYKGRPVFLGSDEGVVFRLYECRPGQ
ncbi:hypothetical protein F5Y16DRAFT_392534 [Xylariaceae sp. FL0255]|nr:hypothetical protein F5Y16DRAFT_392534 [Xylariaceae sp. FL0255]